MHRLRITMLAASAVAGMLAIDAARAWAQPTPPQNPPDATKPQADTAAPAPPGPATATPPQAPPAPTPPQAPQASPPASSAPPANSPAPAPQTPPEPADPTPGKKPTVDEIELAKTAFAEGRQLFDARDFANAVKKFKEAYRLSKNPLLLYNIGFTHDELGEIELALFYYEKFLKDASPAAQVYEEVKRRVEALKKAKEASAVFDSGSMKSSRAPVEEVKPQVTEFMHKVIEETPPRLPLDITAFIPESSGWQLTLFYRGEGDSKFESTIMRQRYNEMVGRIPASKTAGKSLQYYIEVRDRSGTIVDRSGRSTSPHLVFIDAGAQPRYYTDLAVSPAEQERRPDGDTDTGSRGDGSTDAVDRGPSPMQYAKWGSTVATVSILGLAASFNALAAQRAESLAFDATRSTQDCGNPPCRSFSDFQKNLEREGQRYETLTNISLAVGIATAGVAGYLWYRDLSTRQDRPQAPAAGSDAAQTRMIAVPIVNDEVVGAAALLTF